MPDEKSICSFTKFGSTRENACVSQSGRRCVDVGRIKGFSQICSEVGVEPKYSDGIYGVFCCKTVCSDGGILDCIAKKIQRGRRWHRRYSKTNSGCCKVSISSGMDILLMLKFGFGLNV